MKAKLLEHKRALWSKNEEARVIVTSIRLNRITLTLKIQKGLNQEKNSKVKPFLSGDRGKEGIVMATLSLLLTSMTLINFNLGCV